MYLQSSLRIPNSSILCAWSWDKTQEGFPCCMLKLFTLKAHKTSASLGLMGLELDSGLGAAWCGGWGQRLVTVSSVARTVAMRVLRPKITVLLLLFLYLEAKCHLTFLLATACCSGWWLCFHYLGVQGPVATHLCDSGTPGFPRRSGWMREMVACALVCLCAVQSEHWAWLCGLLSF